MGGQLLLERTLPAREHAPGGLGVCRGGADHGDSQAKDAGLCVLLQRVMILAPELAKVGLVVERVVARKGKQRGLRVELAVDALPPRLK
jgi:hypothetical protein